MRRQALYLCISVLAVASSGLTVSGADPVEPSEGERLFALQVQPLLAEKCIACHGADPDDIQGGLDLRTRAALLAGGEAFAKDAVIVGDGEQSMLYVATTRAEGGYEMPPKEADQLSPHQQLAIRDWIDAGAPWPDAERVKQIQAALASGQQVLVSKALSTDWQNRRYEEAKLWAYRPIRPVAVPAGQHPIDWFISRRLEDAMLPAAPAAGSTAMVRRMRFGLTGLPPSPDEVERFEQAYLVDPALAVTTYAEELLQSAQYGEHFGWHWLDATRYADSAGLANDYCRPNAWRYRDYVVRAFNQDKPYDEFVREQIAGDEIDEENPANLIATGLLRMGPWEQTSMSVFKETRAQWLDDVTDTVGQVFLAHSMLCCKCHDHKFDPVPTRDYYRMMAVFSTTQFADREAAFLDDENRDGFSASDRWVAEKVAAYEQQRQALLTKMKQQRTKETGSAKVGDNNLDPGDEASAGRLGKNITRHKIEFDRTKPVAMSVYTGSTIYRKNVAGRIRLPDDRWAEGEIEPDAIRSGGDVYSIGDPVTPGALSAAESLGEMRHIEFPSGKGKRRLALANWIVDSSNPLTARVMANRVWSWHFGKGIAANPNNFGGTGGLPTHPQLLDYLANWLIEHNWSIKGLNRLIVSSEAYRRASHHPDARLVASKDPTGALYATFPSRRLTAEELRDAMLVASGEINLAVGGLPCRPDINAEVAFQPRQIMGGAASVYEPNSQPSVRNRRTLYAERIRGLRDPFLQTFNQPGPDKSCELRETSTVAPQALTLLNSQEVLERSVAMAARLIKQECASDEATIQRAYAITLSRMPSSQELRSCVAQWQQARAQEATKTYRPREYPNQLQRTVMAEKTGQPYSFIEIMPAYARYEPDRTLVDVDAKTRALALLCRVLFNTNEFCYLD